MTSRPPEVPRVVIESRPNGPYLVKNLERLQNSRGELLETKPVCALCRCGGSASKPFCDGTHKTNEFSGENTSDGSKNRRVEYTGAAVTIHDNRGICAHAGFCTDMLPAVFNSKRTPWIDPDGAEPEAIAAAVRRCPSGALALSMSRIEQGDGAGEPTIVVSSNGPYFVTGGIMLEDAPWGEGASRERYALCRCGGSKNKPFCDGTHWSIGFTDEQN